MGGQKGDDGVGLKEKIFTLGQTYNKGDYVFSRSSSSSTKHTMYTAQSTFVAVVYPHLDTSPNHWVEFTAPQGERGLPGAAGATGAAGQKGDKGDKGLQGEKGEKGVQGERGVAGATGATGAQGSQGL